MPLFIPFEKRYTITAADEAAGSANLIIRWGGLRRIRIHHLMGKNNDKRQDMIELSYIIIDEGDERYLHLKSEVVNQTAMPVVFVGPLDIKGVGLICYFGAGNFGVTEGHTVVFSGTYELM